MWPKEVIGAARLLIWTILIGWFMFFVGVVVWFASGAASNLGR